MILYHRFCLIYDIKLFLYLSIPFLLCENFFFHGITICKTRYLVFPAASVFN